MRQPRVLLLGSVVIAMAVGCQCGNPVPESQLVVAFNAPVDGQQLTKGDDTNPALAGLQVNVEVEARDTAGRNIVLESAELLFKPEGSTEWSASGIAAELEGARASFKDFTPPAMNVTLRVNAKEANSSRSAFAQITVGVPSGSSCSLVVNSPSGVNAVINQAKDTNAAMPGAQFKVDGVSSDCLDKTVTISHGSPTPTTVLGTTKTGMDGRFSFDASLMEGMDKLKVEIDDGLGEKTSVTINLNVDITGPAVSIVSPTEAGGPYTGPTLNVSVTVTDAAPGSKVSVYSQTATGTPLGQLDIVGSSAMGVVNFAAGTQTVVATARDANGNLSEASEQNVVITSATLAITVPVGPSFTYRQSNDTLPGTPGFQSSLQYAPAAKVGESVAICVTATPRPGAAADCPGEPAGSSFWLLAQNVPASNSSFTFPEGSYKIKAVLITGASHYSSPTIDLVVDTIRPRIAAFAFQGDANQDGWLNLAESPVGSQKVALITTDLTEDGRPVAVYDSANPATRIKYGEGVVTNNAASVTLSALPATPSATFTLVAEVLDRAGNANQLVAGGSDPVNSEAFKVLRVDQLAPTISISSPTKAQLGIADDAVPGTAAVFDVHAEGVTQSDVATVKFELTGPGGTQTVTSSAVGGVAAADFQLPFSGTSNYSLKLTPTDQAGNVAVSPPTATFIVDVVPPTIALTSPTAGGSPYGYSVPVSVSVTGAEGSIVTISTSALAGQLGTIGPVSGGVAAKTLTFPNGVGQTVTASVTDAAGNSASTSQSNVIVAGTGCSVLISAPNSLYLNASQDTDASTAGLQYSVKGNSANCPSAQVRILRDGTLVGTTTTAANGDFVFPLTLAEGTVTLRAEMTIGAVTFDEKTTTVDITAPVISGVSPAASSFFIVASTNGNLANTAYVVDGDLASADGQLAVSYTVTGAQGGTGRVLYRGSTVDGPVSISSASQAVGAGVSLGHNTNGAFEIRATDVAGNEGVYAATATVDVIAPAIPSLTANVTSRTKVGLSWTASYDDGATAASGNPAGYDLRWTTDVMSSAGIPSEQTFFNTSIVKEETGALLPASTLSYSLSVPWLSTYGVLVRARDEVGNYSPFVASTPLSNSGNLLQISNPGADATFGGNVVAGDLNGDGASDIVASALGTGAPGSVYVIYGAPNLASMTTQTITPAGGLAEQFGTDLSIGQVGDVSGEGRPDLLVGAPGFNANQGRAYLFFGRSSAQLDTTTAGSFLIFVGNDASAPTGVSQLGRSAQIIGDTNGDGLGEILLSAHTENALRGRVYLFYGRSKAQWDTKVVGGVIPLSAADRIFEGPSPVSAVSQGNQFGQRRGFAYLGDITGDGRGDFTIPDSQDSINRVWVFSGAAVSSASAPITTGTDASNPNQALQTLSVGNAAAGTTTLGFGTRAIGNANLIGGTGKDLIVASHRAGQVHIFADGTSSGFTAAPFSIVGTQNFGAGIAQGDLDGDGRPELICGESVTGNSSLRVFLNKGSAGSEFDQVVGTGFAQSRATSTGSLGGSVAVGDFNADGKLDIAAGDANGAGKVILWY